MADIVVTHGDLDGIISVVLVMRKHALRLDDTEIIFVQPFTVDKVVIPDGTERIFAIDVAVNNRDPEMTKNFIRLIGDRLVGWYDHHEGWSVEITGGNLAFVIDVKAGSCSEILGGDPELVADATAADTRKGTLSPRAQLIEQAVKANMADDSIRLLAVKWLLGNDEAHADLEAAAKKYAEIQAETERLAAIYRVTGNVALVDARGSNHQYDLTQLLLAGQKLASFAVALTVHPLQGEVLTIATSRKDVNLVSLFGLGSGAPFRVNLSATKQKEALDKLATL